MNDYSDKSFHPVGTLSPTYPKRRMKKLILMILAALQIGCATTKTTVTAPDGTVTATEDSKPAVKENTKQFAADLIWAFVPRQRPVHPEKEEPKVEKGGGK